MANTGLIEKCVKFEQESVTFRLALNNLKKRVVCQRVLLGRMVDDLRDVNSELKVLVEGLPSVDFF